MNEKLNCEIIRDLMPLCSEGLCSEESRKLVESHISTCEDCRKLYAPLPAQEAPETAVPSETKAMQKLSRRLKFGKLWITLLVLLVLGVGLLTTGQIVKVGSLQSFETLFRNIEVYPVASAVARGDFDRYAEYLSMGRSDNLLLMSNRDAILRQDVENLKTTYQAAFGDTKVKSIFIMSAYTEMVAEKSKVIMSYISVKYTDGREIMLEANKDVDGLWVIELVQYSSNDEEVAQWEANQDPAAEYPSTHYPEDDLADALEFSIYHARYPVGFLEVLLSIEEKPQILDTRIKMISRRFQEEYRDTIRQNLTDYLEAGYLSPEFSLSTPYYDREKQAFYYVFTLIGKDDQGTALMTGHMYYDYRGMMPPEDAAIYPDNCSEELTDAMLHLFG